MIEKLISGGQTGVDRGALDAALYLGVSCGGWCPKGRRAEDGPIPGEYPLKETETARYPQRTERNIIESDGTLVLCAGPLTGGTRLTVELAAKQGRPCLVANPKDGETLERCCDWVAENAIQVLNVAGPRESSAPGIQRQAQEFIEKLLERSAR